tara:strand:+ start:1390 stop:1647 length:258 start_codon:yes stop_codon:yes gene_type:complete
MEELKNNRYLLKGNSYIIDLYNVDFITWKENDKVEATYWAKLHIGSKETRFICNSLSELQTLVQAWTNIRGKEANITEEDLINEW